MLSSNAGVPIGRRPPSSFSIYTRSTGAAGDTPRRRRSWRSRRCSARCSAYLGAVTPSIPAALAWLVWRYASRRKSASIRGASVVQPQAGSRAACAARRWRGGVTVGERKVSPVLLSGATGGPVSPSLPWGPWACVPHLRRDQAARRRPLARLRTLRLALASPYLVCFGAFVVSREGSWSGRHFPRLRQGL